MIEILRVFGQDGDDIIDLVIDDLNKEIYVETRMQAAFLYYTVKHVESYKFEIESGMELLAQTIDVKEHSNYIEIDFRGTGENGDVTVVLTRQDARDLVEKLRLELRKPRPDEMSSHALACARDWDADGVSMANICEHLRERHMVTLSDEEIEKAIRG